MHGGIERLYTSTTAGERSAHGINVERCRPNERCTKAQSVHICTARLTEHHWTSSTPQSAHLIIGSQHSRSSPPERLTDLSKIPSRKKKRMIKLLDVSSEPTMPSVRGAAALSVVGTIAVITNAFHMKAQFYPAVVYISKSQISMMVSCQSGTKPFVADTVYSKKF